MSLLDVSQTDREVVYHEEVVPRRLTLWLIWLISVALRIPLAFLNTRANDNHIEVTQLLTRFNNGEESPAFLGKLERCLECYHPKLFHLGVEYLAQLAGWFDKRHLILTANLVNVTLISIALLFVMRALRRWAPQNHWVAIVYALLCFNPSLLGISVQATNDSFVIALTTIMTYYAFDFAERGRAASLLISACCLFFALLSKGNALVALVWLAFLVFVVFRSERGVISGLLRSSVLLSFVFSIMLLIPPPLSRYHSYVERWQSTGRFGAVNFTPAPRPYFFRTTYARRPGVLSIYDAYFTFKLFSMVHTPFIEHKQREFFPHRTSLWSNLHGRLNFSFFENHVWRCNTRFKVWLGRISIIAGVPLSLLLAFMFLRSIVEVPKEARHLFRDGLSLAELSAVQVFGFLTMLILFTLDHRDFSSMKDIYLMPSLLGVAILLGNFPEYVKGKKLRYCTWLMVIVLMLNLINDVTMVLDRFA